MLSQHRWDFLKPHCSHASAKLQSKGAIFLDVFTCCFQSTFVQYQNATIRRIPPLHGRPSQCQRIRRVAFNPTLTIFQLSIAFAVEFPIASVAKSTTFTQFGKIPRARVATSVSRTCATLLIDVFRDLSLASRRTQLAEVVRSSQKGG